MRLRQVVIKPVVKSGQAERVKNSRAYALLRARSGTRPESSWTKPREDCPHPEWWTATDGDSTETEVTELVAAFVRALQPQYVVETGTAFGQTSRAIGKALKRNGHGHLDTLEVDPHRCTQARLVTRGLPVNVIERASLEFKPTRRVDFAWFDSLIELRVPEFYRF